MGGESKEAAPPIRCSAKLAAYGVALLIAWTALLGLLLSHDSPKRYHQAERTLDRLLLGELPHSADAAASPEGTAEPQRPSESSYNPNSIAEMQKAAAALLLPEQQRGPLPVLVRDMSAALAKKEREEEEMRRKLTLLQPAVSNYNPADAEQLSKAAVDAATPGEVSGALSKLLRDLGTTVADQQAARRGAEVRRARAEEKAERASARLRVGRRGVGTDAGPAEIGGWS